MANSIVYHEKALHNCLITCYRKCICLHNACRVRWPGSVLPTNTTAVCILIGCIFSGMVYRNDDAHQQNPA